METGLHIGTKISKETLEPLTNSIIQIMSQKADQQTIRTALELLMTKVETKVENCSLSNISITGANPTTESPYESAYNWEDND